MSETQIQTCSKANKRKVKITPIFKSPEIISLAFWYLLLHSLHTYMCIFFDKQRWDLCVCLVAQSCPTLCNPMDCGPPGSSSAHGDSPGKNTGVGCHALLQGIFPTQGLNPDLPHCRQILYCLSYQGSFLSLQTAFFM